MSAASHHMWRLLLVERGAEAVSAMLAFVAIGIGAFYAIPHGHYILTRHSIVPLVQVTQLFGVPFTWALLPWGAALIGCGAGVLATLTRRWRAGLHGTFLLAVIGVFFSITTTGELIAHPSDTFWPLTPLWLFVAVVAAVRWANVKAAHAGIRGG